MNKDEKKILNKINDTTNLKFDFTELENRIDYDQYQKKLHKNKKSKITKNIVTIVSCTIVLVFIATPFLMMLTTTSRQRVYARHYTLNEVEAIQNSSFKSLNKITYPSGELSNYKVEDEYLSAIRDFSYNIYQAYDKKENFSFSPLSLYSNLEIISLSSKNNMVINEFDEILGLNRFRRKENYRNLYRNNFFYNNDGSIQLYNGIFLSNEYEPNQNFINELQSYYTEAFQLDFKNEQDIELMLDWVNQKTNESNFIDKDFLNLNHDYLIYYFTTLYFNNYWRTKFFQSENTFDYFYPTDGVPYKTTYMNHSYNGKIYDYDKYYSVYDYYKNDLKIQYLIPKNSADNIYSLLSNINFINENEDNLVKSPKIINLTLPKFTSTSSCDFITTLKNVGFNHLFNNNSLDGVFTDYHDVTLSELKQKNKISFTEDGTTIKSVTMGAGAKNTSILTYEIRLNQPFIYVIYDRNNLPLYIGHFDNIQ